MSLSNAVPQNPLPTRELPIRRARLGGVTVVSVDRPLEIDAGNLQAFESALLDEASDAAFLVLDASRIEYFGSEAMDLLLTVQERVSAARGRFAVAGLNRAVSEVFRLAGLDCALSLFADTDRAVLGLLRARAERDVWH